MEGKTKWLLVLPVIVVYVIGMFTDVMKPDAAQYATMSVEMLKTGNYLELFYRGEDYIDKPPLIFWLSALSFKAFGISNFSYKLPSVLFCFLGLFATYRLGRLLYSERVGFYAVLILSTTQAWFLCNQDVRTDTILAACTILAIWQLTVFDTNKKFIHIVYASLGVAGAMLTKGPIGLMVPGLAMGTHYILRREWNRFFQWQYAVLFLLVLFFISPMLYGLYTQFDLKGNKKTYNGIIDSGLRFYFWTQSFGRLTGESIWKNDYGPLYFVHTFLWTFIPWCLLFAVAFAKKFWFLYKNKFYILKKDEAITWGGILIPFIAFSLSSYKLPHYIFVFFPLAALLTGKYVADIVELEDPGQSFKMLRIVQSTLAGFLLLITLLICIKVFPLSNLWIGTAVAIGFITAIYFTFQKTSRFQHLIFPAWLAAILLNFTLNIHFYPALLQYQSEAIAGRAVKSYVVEYPFIAYKYHSYSLDFYYQNAVPIVDNTEMLTKRYRHQQVWIYVREEGLKELQQIPMEVLQVEKLDNYPVTKLSLKFLSPDTRDTQTETHYLMLVKIE